MMGKSFLYTAFTVLAVSSCSAIFFIPETKGKEIPDTIADCLKRAREEKTSKRANKKRSTGEKGGEEENSV